MGNAYSSNNKINYEDMQHIVKHPELHILINTLSENEQYCLIPNTLNINQEEAFINKLIQSGKMEIKIIIYGKNCNDDKLYKKQQQLTSLGFYNVYIYLGGLFEWLCLQDIYGADDFPTTKKELDLLKYKSTKKLNVHLIEYC
jgi:hypothetical protein